MYFVWCLWEAFHLRNGSIQTQRLRHGCSVVTGDEYMLVMSDEFEEDGRSFADGEDPKWTAFRVGGSEGK